MHRTVVIIGSASSCAMIGLSSIRKSGGKDSHRNYGGRYNMPGYMMTKAGKRAQMQKDFNRASPRKGKPR